MIKPSNGRIVLYHPGSWDAGIIQLDRAQPLAATVAHVHNDRLVNLSVTDSMGVKHQRADVQLLQDGDPATGGGAAYCEWMPLGGRELHLLDQRLAILAGVLVLLRELPRVVTLQLGLPEGPSRQD